MDKHIATVLGIESSCDETGVAIYQKDKGIVADKLYSQVAMHKDYGGVVPELASRDHVRRVIPLIKDCLAEANMQPEDIDALAYTAGPGLVGALLVGSACAKALGFAWQIPTLAVHHMEGHLLAPLLTDSSIEPPFIALLVSGGHTMLVLVNDIGEYELLGESIDDAAGEAFDKTAKLLGLSYPGGPAVSKLAAQGVEGRFKFPRPMTDRPGLDFSFSGLKTYAMNSISTNDDSAQTKADIALAFEVAVVETLLIKCARAVKQTQCKTLVLAGGVSANSRLRSRFKNWADNEGIALAYPELKYCTDNGAMIAFAGFHRFRQGLKDADFSVRVRPRWPLNEKVS